MRIPGSHIFLLLRCLLIVPLCVLAPAQIHAQGRVVFNGHPVFLSGSNIAWLKFAEDLGPAPADTSAFAAMFDSVRAAGGNAMRLWLHTNGAWTPEYNSAGMVVGPGANTLVNLQAIARTAWDRKVGLILCLWSFDMLRTSFGVGLTDRTMRLLTDTTWLQAYASNALVPMVSAVAGSPGVIAWEVFNEPEGMSEEFGWEFTRHVPMWVIQRAVNRMAGAIHRADPSAQVTSGAWSFISQSDVSYLLKAPAAVQLSEDERSRIETGFASRYGASIPAERILARFNASSNRNFYRDDRLISSGGDPFGVLDFYSVHYYVWGGSRLSPFHHPYSAWKLDKPLIVAEFYLEPTFGLDFPSLYPQLFSTGYAGAMTWSWTGDAVQRVRTISALADLFAKHPRDLDPAAATGTIYGFTANPQLVGRGDESVLEWQASAGSAVTLNGTPVPDSGAVGVAPDSTTTYVLVARGTVSDTVSLAVTVVPWEQVIPAGFVLHQNYPNPANPATTIRLDLPTTSTVRLSVFDLLGRELVRLVDGLMEPGRHLVPWRASVATGMYVYHLQAVPFDGTGAAFSASKKILIVR